MMDIILAQSAGQNGQDINSICLGSGRFLRSVLVPFLSSNSKVAVFQTRGRTFLDSFKQQQKQKHININFSSNKDAVDADGNVGVVKSLCYPVDTIQFDGNTTTSNIQISAAGTLGTLEGKAQLIDKMLSKIKQISIIGVGVTEAGLSNANNQCMIDLTELLYKIYCNKQLVKCSNPHGRICIINTDNVPSNGNVICDHILNNAKNYQDGGDFVDFVKNKVAFLNSMVDRITSSRSKSNGLLPLCEPLPQKALVICDPGNDLPSWMNDDSIQSEFGVKIRHDPTDLANDIALKLRVANGTHTAVAHCMALSSLVNTDALCDESSKVILDYLESLYTKQILPAAVADGISGNETNATWEDWRKRLQHLHFGLSTFFITQNGAAKCGIRLGPTIQSLICAKRESLSVAMVFAVAAILRCLTPIVVNEGGSLTDGWTELISSAKERGVYVGWLDGSDCKEGIQTLSSDDTVTYADGLRYNLKEGWYEFRCDCLMESKGNQVNLSDLLARAGLKHRNDRFKEVIRSYLLHSNGGNLQSLLEFDDEEEKLSRARALDAFVTAVTIVYARMVGGDDAIALLKEMAKKEAVYQEGFASSCFI